MKLKLFILTALLPLLIVHFSAQAKKGENGQDGRKVPRSKVNTEKEARMDKNDDGRVGPKEILKAKTTGYLRNNSEVDTKWEKKADTNHDGVVDRSEIKDWYDRNDDGKITPQEAKAALQRQRAKVSNPFERRYDADGNGWISHQERREMVKAKLRLIDTHGKAKVDTPWERFFDANNDGVITRNEAVRMREALADLNK